MFAQRIQALATEAFPGTLHVGSVQTQVIRYLIDGLRYNYIKLKIMRNNAAGLKYANVNEQ